MRKGKMMYIPGEVAEELEHIKKSQGINRNTSAFDILMSDFKLGQEIKKKFKNKSKDILGFDI